MITPDREGERKRAREGGRVIVCREREGKRKRGREGGRWERGREVRDR